jgi:glucosyltransferase Lgt1/2/3
MSNKDGQLWLFILITQAKCKREDAELIIRSLKRVLRPFPEDKIGQLLNNSLFVQRIEQYNQYGINSVLTWLNKQKIFSSFNSLQDNLDVVNVVTVVESPTTRNIYGYLTSAKSKERKALQAEAERLVIEIIGSNSPNNKLKTHVFEQLAHMLDEQFNASEFENLRNELFRKLASTVEETPPTEFFMDRLNACSKRIKASLRQPNPSLFGVAVDTTEPYQFSTKNSFSIWLSNNPKIAMPETHKKILVARAEALAPGLARLIYSSKCLNNEVNEDFVKWAEENNIILINFDDLVSTLPRDSYDEKLASFAQLEIDNMLAKSGGNPAAASDLIRWISTLSNDSCTYIDVDMPLSTPLIEEDTVRAGCPVLINIGSVLERDGNRLPIEVEAYNTDIISFCEQGPQRQQVMKKIAHFLVENYTNCVALIAQSKDPILIRLKAMPGYRRLVDEFGKNINLPIIRHSVCKAHDNLISYVKYIGIDIFSNLYNKGKDKLLLHEALKQGNEHPFKLIMTKYIQHIPGYSEMAGNNEIKAFLKRELALVYKPLVMDFSGPGAIASLIMAEQPPRTESYRAFPKLAGNLSGSPLRTLQNHACVAGKTNFISDNIPKWGTAKAVSDQQQIDRTDGLSWMPAEQNKLAL